MMAFEVEGGIPLKGEVKISGAKNAAIKFLVATMLTEEASLLYNVPEIGDLNITRDLCRHLGANFRWEGPNTLSAHTPSFARHTIDPEMGRKNRMSIMLMAPLLHRVGRAVVPAPGGCNIGKRPVNFHVQALEQMGAEIEYEGGIYYAKADRLQGARIDMPYPSVSATENVIMCATLAKGTTIIQNAAVEPEIMDLIQFLQKMGAIIEVGVNRKIVIEGVDKLRGAEHYVIPDRLEAASYAVACLATKGDVFVREARQRDMITFLNTIRRMGGDFEIDPEGIRFTYRRPMQSIAIETDVHPGFMTDWQQPFVLLMTQSEGMGIVHETVYEDRFGYTSGLNKMGADIHIFQKCLGDKPCRFRECGHNHSAVVKGPTPLYGTELNIPDLRAGCSYLIAAVVAQGKSTLTGLHLLDRGYERIDEKFRALGARIERVTAAPRIQRAA